MEMEPVESTNLAAVGYDVVTKTLRVRFLSGATWDYDKVPARVHAELMAAASKGSYFTQHIKPVYEARQVESKKP